MEQISKITQNLTQSIKTRFEESKRVLTFDEFLDLAHEIPHLVLRDAANYLLDATGYFGTEKVNIRASEVQRLKLFNHAFSERPQPVYGQEAAGNRLLQILTGFVRSGRTNKLIVLHGPNGSAKTSLIRTLFDGLEAYSKTSEGRIFHFSWIFPTESYEKGSLGIGARRDSSAAPPTSSFARLDPERVGAIVRSELHENPLYLIPREERKDIFDQWWKSCPKNGRVGLERLRDSFFQGELSHKNALIFEALLNDYSGDFKRVLRHVRVERLFLSRRFRRGLVSVEPQFGVDAQIRQVTLDRSMANLPPALQSLNLFQLEGDLVDGNRCIVEFNDFLKRPLEHFKYLLGTCESGTVNLGHVVAFLDTVLVATTDERHLEAFREHPEYPSFKSRLEFIRVPYLLRFSDEEKIYRTSAEAAKGPKELMPHTTKVLALWAVLTRLKRPLLKNKNSVLTRILENLTPLAKAKLYDSGELPEKLSDEERKELKGHIEELIEEQQNQPYYEGLLGASARELKAVIQMASQNDQFPTLGPNAILAELRKIVKRPMDFEYLRLEPNQGYHAFEDLIGVVFEEWMNWVDREMRICFEFQSEAQFLETLTRYMTHATAHVSGEKLKNRITGQNEVADIDLMLDFENKVGASGDIEEFRKNLISRLGAWSVENAGWDKKKGLPYERIFPDLLEKLSIKHHEAQVSRIKEIGAVLIDANALESADKDSSGTLGENSQMALKAFRGLQEKFGYGPAGAKEALVTLMKARYV